MLRTALFLPILLAMPVAPVAPPGADYPVQAPQAAEDDSLAGIWRFSTSDGDGEGELTGTVCVWRQRDRYLVQWSGAAQTEESLGLVQMDGVGIRTGDSFAVGWGKHPAKGVSLFKIEAKRLVGRWIAAPGGNGTARAETWTWLAHHPKKA